MRSPGEPLPPSSRPPLPPSDLLARVDHPDCPPPASPSLHRLRPQPHPPPPHPPHGSRSSPSARPRRPTASIAIAQLPSRGLSFQLWARHHPLEAPRCPCLRPRREPLSPILTCPRPPCAAGGGSAILELGSGTGLIGIAARGRARRWRHRYRPPATRVPKSQLVVDANADGFAAAAF
ncbi:hypothetical protein NL676_002503 [Syzygium grande]|nr:hypothetical protein NL676_002503 [Syzygium grande]